MPLSDPNMRVSSSVFYHVVSADSQIQKPFCSVVLRLYQNVPAIRILFLLIDESW